MRTELRTCYKVITIAGITSGSISKNILLKVDAAFERLDGIQYSAKADLGGIVGALFGSATGSLGLLNLKINNRKIIFNDDVKMNDPSLRFRTRQPQDMGKIKLLNGSLIEGFFIDKALSNHYPYTLTITLKGKQRVQIG